LANEPIFSLSYFSAGKAGMFSHQSLHNSGESFFSISMTLTLECGLLTPLYSTKPLYCTKSLCRRS